VYVDAYENLGSSRGDVSNNVAANEVSACGLLIRSRQLALNSCDDYNLAPIGLHALHAGPEGVVLPYGGEQGGGVHGQDAGLLKDEVVAAPNFDEYGWRTACRSDDLSW
jgi:hypothetical protein